MNTTTVETTLVYGNLVELEGAMIFEYAVDGRVFAQLTANHERDIWTARALDFRFYVEGAQMRTAQTIARGPSEEEAHRLATMWALSAAPF